MTTQCKYCGKFCLQVYGALCNWDSMLYSKIWDPHCVNFGNNVILHVPCKDFYTWFLKV
jgi:hypothetical protein